MDNKFGLAEFASKYPLVHYPKNSLVIYDDGNSKFVYFLEKGLIRQYSLSRSGSVLMTHIFRIGSFFPPAAVYETDTDSGYYEAFNKSDLRVIPKDEFRDFLQSRPDLLIEYVAKLSKYLTMLSKRINLFAGFSAYQRTAASLIYLSERIGQKDEKSGKTIIQEVLTHKDLCGWVGTTRETTSVQMKTLQKKGCISYQDRKIVIDNWEKLISEAGN